VNIDKKYRGCEFIMNRAAYHRIMIFILYFAITCCLIFIAYNLVLDYNHVPVYVVEQYNSKKSIVLWSPIPDFERTMVDRYKRIFNAENITVVNVAPDEIMTKLRVFIATAADIPDIVAINRSHVNNDEAAYMFEDLSAPPYSLETDIYLDCLCKEITTGDGRVVGVPMSPAPLALAYRRDLANRFIGTDKPEELYPLIQDWEDFVSVAKTVKERSEGKVYCFASLDRLWDVRYAQNARPIVKGKKIAFTENYLNDVAFIKMMYDEGLILGVRSNTQKEKESYRDGSVIFFPLYPWEVKVNINDFDRRITSRWNLVQLPGKQCTLDCIMYCIPRDSENKSGAWKYLKWAYASPQGNEFMVRDTQTIPALKGFYTGEYDVPKSEITGTDIMDFWTPLVNRAMERERPQLDKTMDRLIKHELENMIRNGTKPEDACRNIEHKIKEYFGDLEI